MCTRTTFNQCWDTPGTRSTTESPSVLAGASRRDRWCGRCSARGLLASSSRSSREGTIVRQPGRSASAAAALLVLALAAPAEALDIGNVAPDFHLRALDGREISLADAEKTHRAVVVLFISTICPYSNYYND